MSGIAEHPQPVLRREPLSVSEFSISLTVCVATGAAVAVALVHSTAGTRNIALSVFLLGAALIFGPALADLVRAREVPFARALIVAGLLWSLSALTASGAPVLYSVGRVSQWCVALAIVYLLLSYPSGRLAAKTDRATFAAGALLLGFFYLPTALVAAQFPHPSLWSMCTSGCPRNVFSLAHSTPALITDLVVPARQVLTVALMAAIAVVVIRRVRDSGPRRGLYAPIAMFAVFQVAVWATYFPLREAAPGSGALPVVGWLFVMSLPLLGLVGGTGRLHRRTAGATAEDPMLIQIAGSYALAALENDRLRSELESSLAQLEESRMLRLTAEQSVRQKIERDLHDGAQQRLVALRVKLELAANALEVEDPGPAAVVRALGEEVDSTIDEVRSFARGIYPPLLARTGLQQALRSASIDAPLATTVQADRLRRYTPETEATVYFSCSEALHNACKHARGATRVTISVWQDTQLRFEVCDDGAGFDLRTTAYGTGLTNLRERLVAIGGTIKIQSAPGHGTVVGGSIPLARACDTRDQRV